MAQERLITFTDRGIYCPRADVYIDPWKPVSRALITHGHADHARAGHDHYMCTTSAAPIMRHRLGNIDLQTVEYDVPFEINGVEISFHPAGHVIGSAQIKLAYKGEIWVISGDYKIEPDGISEPFEPIQCTHFVSECTFGLPIFTWDPQATVAAQINTWWRSNSAAGITSFIGAYSLGKAQRILSLLDTDIAAILTHGAIETSNQILRAQGVHLPGTQLVTPDFNHKSHQGALILAPPSALGSKWAQKFGAHSSGFASGWMRLRGVRRRKALDQGFVMSDHADWAGLLTAIKATNAENIYVTHGYTEIFARHLNSIGYNAAIVETAFEGEAAQQDDTDESVAS
jgi:putative mRNA 3-end processing factor